jgi:hypothetical protein
MAITRICKRSSIALLAAGSLATLALPQGRAIGGSQEGGSAVGAVLEQISGSAVGTIDMPTATELGILVAVGQSKDGRVFMLDAELTSVIPDLFDEHTRVAFGSVSGELYEAPVGGSGGANAPFDGVVEGMWRMDKSLEGSYEALVYERDDSKGLKLVGRISGMFRVEAAESAVPGPVLGDGVVNKKELRWPLGDARQRLVPYGDDVVEVPGPKNANDHLGDARSKASESALIPDDPFDIAREAKAIHYSGATKLEFKILD